MTRIIFLLTLILFISSCGKDEPSGGSESASCSDGVQNGMETGVDCGGDCSACTSCSDGILNGNETGVDCGGDCDPCPSSEKEILSITFEDSPGDFDPIIEINAAAKEVYISVGKVFPTTDISNLTFEVGLSSGATIPNLPRDYSSPQQIEVIAEDGSSQQYKVIVSGAYGTLTRVGGGIESWEESRAIYQRARVSESNSVYITLESDPGLGDFYYYKYFIVLDDVTLSNSLVGDHALKTWTSTGISSFCNLTCPANGGREELGRLETGYLKITKHDLQNKLVSGQLLDMSYKALNTSVYDTYYPYVEFINLRYE